MGWEDPLEKEMANHSTILAWRIPWTERSLAGYSPGAINSRTQLSDSHTQDILHCKTHNYFMYHYFMSLLYESNNATN